MVCVSFRPDVLEVLAAVGGLVDAGAERRALTVVRLARADVDDVGVRRCQLDVADGGDRELVEDRRPRGAVVDGLPDAAGRVADVERRGVALVDGDVVDASAHDRRADRAPDEPFEHRVVRFVHRPRGRRFLGLRLFGQHARSSTDRKESQTGPHQQPHAHVSYHVDDLPPVTRSVGSDPDSIKIRPLLLLARTRQQSRVIYYID